MTVISHKHRFIFLCPRKTASTSIRVTLDSIIADADIALSNHKDDAQFNKVLDESKYTIKNRPANDKALGKLTAIERSRGSHLSINAVIKMVGEDVWDSYFKFAVVRNPWDWFASLYFFIMHRASADQLFSRRLNKMGNALISMVKSPRDYRNNLQYFYYSFKVFCSTGLAYCFFRLGYHRIAAEIVVNSGVYQYIFEEMKKGEYYFRNGKPALDAYIRFEHLSSDFNDVCKRLQLPQLELAKAKTKARQNKDYRCIYNKRTKRKIEQECADIIKHFDYSF